MRGCLAARAADRVSRCVILTAGLLCGTLVFFVALPLAMSTPFPTPRDGAWVIERATFELASLPPTPAPRLPVPDAAIIEETDGLRAEAAAFLDDLDISAAIESTRALAYAPDVDPDITGSIGKLTAPDQPAATQQAALPIEKTPPARKRPASPMEQVDEYLWEVYQRVPSKRDSTGDFTWKDPAAAKRMGVSMPAYVIGGMDPDFREQLYHAGQAMDAAGVRWSMLSAFRDDYRQRLASGFKARPGNSLHGGSRATGGYGHGRAVDITGADDNHSAVWRWIDRNGAKYGLSRPMPGADPAHVQSRGSWHNIAIALRASRVKTAEASQEPGTQTAARRSRMSARPES
jgi:hypothetical protein